MKISVILILVGLYALIMQLLIMKYGVKKEDESAGDMIKRWINYSFIFMGAVGIILFLWDINFVGCI